MKSAHVLTAVLLILPLFAFAQQPWAPATSPTTNTLWGITYGEDRFVAVGENGTIVSSPDGLTWTAQASGTNRWLLGITWSTTLKRFVAVGDAGTVLTSPDGIIWTAQNSGTTQRLNSVAWAQKQFTYPNVFLAVGENGTAIVSYDAVTWSTRSTGETGWLRGITTGGAWDTFIVTGHDGTILRTSDGGDTFTRQDSGATAHLDAVAPFNNGFNATGANLAMTRTTYPYQTWNVDRALNSDGSENGITYNGLVTFNSALVVVGDNGRIVDEFGRRWLQTTPLTTGWRAVAASLTRVVAVGTSGGIASAPIDPGVPRELKISPTSVGDSVLLTATQLRPGAYANAYQWSLNGAPINGATTATLTLSPTSAAAGGTYSVTATYRNSGAPDATATASVTLPANPSPAANALIDTTFHPAVAAAPTVILPLPDGRMLVAGASMPPVRLNRDGTVDRTFTVAASPFPSGTVRALILQPDNRLVVQVQTATNPAAYTLVRLNADGTTDATFVPDAAMSSSESAPILLANGEWLVPQISTGESGTPAVVVRRCLATGAIDATFASVTLPVTYTATLFGEGPRFVSTRDVEGRVYLSVRYGDTINSTLASNSGKSRLFRLLTDGSLDRAFVPADVSPLQQIVATTDGLILRTLETGWARMLGMMYRSRLQRLRADGTADPAYQSTESFWVLGTDPVVMTDVQDGFTIMTVAPDGAIIARSVGRLGHFGLVRFDHSGRLDRDFAAELGTDAGAMTQLAALADGSVIVGGTFTSIGGVAQPRLARLVPYRHATQTYLSNVSVRARAGGAAGPLIIGFITAGGDTTVLGRAAGPALAGFSVADRLADPQLVLFSGTAEVGRNDDWSSDQADLLTSTGIRVGAFPFAAGSKDAALQVASHAGPYTLHISGKAADSGTVLGEVYHAGAAPTGPASPRIINCSVRTVAGTGADTLIVGFAIAGDTPRNVLIRGVGPSLASFNVPDILADPVLTIYRENTAIATNDDWAPNPEVQRLVNEAGRTVGAFALQVSTTYPRSGDKDAAMIVSLPPGAYTVHVSGKNGAFGTALAEVYEIP